MNPPLKIIVYKIVKIHLPYPLLPLSSLEGGGGGGGGGVRNSERFLQEKHFLPEVMLEIRLTFS